MGIINIDNHSCFKEFQKDRLFFAAAGVLLNTLADNIHLRSQEVDFFIYFEELHKYRHDDESCC